MPRPGTDNAHARSPVPTEEKGELAAAFRTFRSAVVGIGLFSAVSNVLMLTGPLFMLEIYDRVLPSRSVPTLVLLLLLVAMLFAAQGVIDWIRARMMVRIGSALDETLSSRVHQTLVRLALRGGKAEGLEPVRDLDSIRSFLSGLGPTALFDLPWIPLYLCVIFALHPLLGLTALVGSIMLIGLALLAEHLTQAPIKSATAHGKARYDLAEASRRNAEVLAAMGFGHRIGELWRQANRNHVAGQQRASDVAAGFGSVSRAGADVFKGGSGNDMASYAGSNAGVSADLETGATSGGHADGDRFEEGIDGLIGSDHADALLGNQHYNRLEGGAGNDLLEGRGGQDTLLGGAGDDRLEGGTGDDWLQGGEGQDTFAFAAGGGHDTIADFEEGDRIELDAASFARLDSALAEAVQQGNDVVVDFDGTAITFANTRLESITAGDFHLAS